MASPLLSAFCCEFRGSNSSEIVPLQLSKAEMSYNILCIISSLLGVAGAIYQLQLRLLVGWRQSSSLPEVIDRQSKIIFWLATADGLASLGILCRSCVRLIDIHASFDLFCAISAGWIQYFFICTYIWTIIFAVDMYKNAADKNRCSMRLYHVISWLVSLFLCVGGLAILYCHGLSSCGSISLIYHLPHFLATYIPVLCVMIINPVLFYCTAYLVKKDLRQRGSSVNEQKKIVGEVISKFRSVVLIFYICWLPNVINGIWVLSRSQWNSGESREIKIPNDQVHSVFVALWQIMALLNPIQGFLNSIVYSDIARWPRNQVTRVRRRSSAPSGVIATSDPILTEEEPIPAASSFSGGTHWAQEQSETSPLLLFR